MPLIIRFIHLAPVAQRLDRAIHQINHYLVENYYRRETKLNCIIHGIESCRVFIHLLNNQALPSLSPKSDKNQVSSNNITT